MSVRVLKPTSLQEAYTLARVQDALWNKKGSWERSNKIHVNEGGRMQRSMARTVVNANLNHNEAGKGILALPGTNSDKAPTKMNRKLSGREIDEKRQKGLCFWCDEKFVPGHRCYKRQLYMLTIEGDANEDLEVNEEWESGEKLMLENSETPQLSVNALTGIGSFQTMRIKGNYGTRTLFLLIDSGSTHNFIDSRIAKQMGCVLEPISGVRFSVTNGNMIVCNEICKQFQWGMNGRIFQADFLILPLDNFDMILGI